MKKDTPPAERPERPPRVLEPVPPEPRTVNPPEDGSRDGLRVALGVPSASRQGDLLVIRNDPALPTRLCIRSGRPGAKAVMVNLRDPRNPMTWFGKRPRIEVGLCRKHHENMCIAVALTWSMLSLGAVLVIVGMLTTGIFPLGVGLFSMAIAGIFRASCPVTSPDATHSSATIHGVSPTYLRQFPVWTETGEPGEDDPAHGLE